jgi:hypothetical protein
MNCIKTLQIYKTFFYINYLFFMFYNIKSGIFQKYSKSFQLSIYRGFE